MVPSGGTAAAATQSWGPEGLLSTPSAVTLRWDNTGNPAADQVPRDASQTIPHTVVKTYADVDSTIRDEYAKYFGAENGLGGLSVTVTQTTGLTSQAVQVAVAGAAGGRDSNGTGSLLQVMQCWGAMKADGTPDLAATQPDPATCEVGPGGSDVSGVPDRWMGRVLNSDPLVDGGDWDQKDPGGFTLPAPFQAINGQTYRGKESSDALQGRDNPFFNHTTTNELTALRPDASGKAQGLFEIQTGQQSDALGCGLRAGVPSVANCWLVLMPRPEYDSPAGPGVSLGAVSPSVWAQRLQLKLSFQDLAQSCPGGAARTLSAGSELLTTAMASWIPGVCNAKRIGAGFTQLGDAQARQQLTSSGGLIFTTRPIANDSTNFYAPAALTAPVIAFTADADASAATLGQIRDLRLNARLVAKLLTQSYRYGMDDQAGSELKVKAPWYLTQVRSLSDDPEFRKLNPGVLLYLSPAASGDLLVENLLSDAGAQVWQWLLHDPDAQSFLNGCPDADGMVINPFYSTRTYSGCDASKSLLDGAAQAKITKTTTPTDFVYAPMLYPPDGAAYPQLGWYQRAAENFGPGVVAPPLTWNDLHARVANLASAGRNAFQALYPSNTIFCLYSSDSNCIPQPGVWKSGGRQNLGYRIVMTITDASTAARFQLPTAKLCDDSGAHCIGADQASLTKAAASFDQSDVAGVSKPALNPDYASGAYPLTMPVYAAIGTDGLKKSDATAYASLLDYLSTTGQKPGLESGLLPPGYAPLTPAMVAQTATLVKTLADFQVPVGVGTSVPESAPPAAIVPQSFTPPLLPASVASTPSSPTKPIVLAQTGMTGRTEIGFPQFGLVGGLGAALASGLMAPILTRRRKALDQ